MWKKQKVMKSLDAALGPKGTYHFLRELIKSGEISVALDVGCGVSSVLTQYRPNLITIGLDVFTADMAADNAAHDHYIDTNILTCELRDVRHKLSQAIGRDTVDLVTMFGVIEHFEKADGWAVLKKIEQLTDKYVFLETPNGFVPQGPEYGNPYQRHLSGWFCDDFRGVGYDVMGGMGTKYLRGYMGEPRFPIPGLRLFDNVVASRALLTKHFPSQSFHLCAVKDVRGVAARYQSYDDPTRA